MLSIQPGIWYSQVLRGHGPAFWPHLPLTCVKYDSMPGFSLTSLLTSSQWWVLLETKAILLIISYDCAAS